MSERLPIIVLGGSDTRPGPKPQGIAREEMLSGFKGTLRLPWGRCLAGELIDRLRQSERFADPILVGPRRMYADLIDAEIVDVEGDLSHTLECVRRLIHARFPGSAPVAFSTCDILPQPAEIDRLLEDSYAPHADCVFWGQLVEARAEEMGASSWKPVYRLPPDDGQPPLTLYPGHLLIVRPETLRLPLVNHLLQLAYRHRNLDIHKRRLRMIVRGLGRLIVEDLRNLFRLQLPVLSVSIPWICQRSYLRLRREEFSVREFEQAVNRVFVHRDFHHAAHGRPVVFSITRLLAFAKDVDTQAELSEAEPTAAGRAMRDKG